MIVDIVKESGLSGPRRGRFSNRTQMEFHAEERRRSELRRVQLRRERTGNLPRPGYSALTIPHSLIEGMAIGGFAMDVRPSAYNYIRGEFMDEPFRRFETALAEAYGEPVCSARTSSARGSISTCTSHLGAGAYICGEETACWNPWKAKRACRDSSRRSRPISVFTARRRPSTTRRPSPPCRRSCATAPTGSRNSGPNNGRHQMFFPSPDTSIARAISKCPWVFPFAELLEMAGWRARWPRKLKAVIPGGSSVPVVPGN